MLLRRPLPLLCLFLLLGLFLSSHAIAGTTFYVDNSGSPACANTSGQAGSQAAPFCGVQYGVSRMASGDTLYVKNGTYDESFTITGPSGAAGAHTVISAFAGHTPILQGSGLSSGRMKITGGCSYIDFTGFTITNMNQGLYVDDDSGTKTPCNHITVTGVTVHDVGQEGIAIRGGPTNIVVTGSTVYNTGMTHAFNGEGIYVGASSGVDTTNAVTLSNNTIYSTQDECIELKGDTHDVIVDGNNLSH